MMKFVIILISVNYCYVAEAWLRVADYLECDVIPVCNLQPLSERGILHSAFAAFSSMFNVFVRGVLFGYTRSPWAPGGTRFPVFPPAGL